MKLITLFPRREVYTYRRPEAARAMYAALPWFYVRVLLDRPGRLVESLTARFPHYDGDPDHVPGQPQIA